MRKTVKHLLVSLSIAIAGNLTVAAVNLVPNGDFETAPYNPPDSFTSDYTLVSGAPNSLFPESTFYVGTNPSLYHSAFTSYNDHTLNSPNGHMLIVNGSSDTSKNVWKSVSFAVSPGTDYFFEAFISSAHPQSPAMLSFIADGNNDAADALLGVGNAPAVTGVWQGISQTWNSGLNTSVTLFLRNANPATGGNDFAIDDINFSETSIVNTPEASSTFAYAIIGFGICLLANRHLSRA